MLWLPNRWRIHLDSQENERFIRFRSDSRQFQLLTGTFDRLFTDGNFLRTHIHHDSRFFVCAWKKSTMFVVEQTQKYYWTDTTWSRHFYISFRLLILVQSTSFPSKSIICRETVFFRFRSWLLAISRTKHDFKAHLYVSLDRAVSKYA